jgi:hypothetical protein
MWAMQQKAVFVLWNAEFKSDVTVQQVTKVTSKEKSTSSESLVETVQRKGKCSETEIFKSIRNIGRECGAH